MTTTAEKLATLTPGNTGADIMNICNEAAIIAARRKLDTVDMECFLASLERVQVGIRRKSKKLSNEERARVACHEAGHAVMNWNLQHVDPITEVSIVQYGGTRLSHSRTLPKDKYIRLQAELEEHLCALLGGTVAEELMFGELSTCAADDLHRITELARRFVLEYGLAPDVIGHFGFVEPESDFIVQKPYGSELERTLDAVVKALVERLKQRTTNLLREHMQQLRILQGMLLRQESVTAAEITVVLGPRQHVTKEYEEYLTRT